MALSRVTQLAKWPEGFNTHRFELQRAETRLLHQHVYESQVKYIVFFIKVVEVILLDRPFVFTVHIFTEQSRMYDSKLAHMLWSQFYGKSHERDKTNYNYIISLPLAREKSRRKI